MWLRVAAQNVCLHEDSGLPLYHEGAAFKLEARVVEVHDSPPAETFALPKEAAKREIVEEESGLDQSEASSRAELMALLEAATRGELEGLIARVTRLEPLGPGDP